MTAAIENLLGSEAFAHIPNFIGADDAVELRELYDCDRMFRSRVVMERHNFGHGEYKYFANPLPAKIQSLRERLYMMLRPIANDWMKRLGSTIIYPSSHQAFLDECFAVEQKRPTALLLKYQTGDYNRLHQDLYGPVAFPLQATIYLSRRDVEFQGGEVVLAEQKPRAQTRAHVLNPDQGDLLVLPTRAAPRGSGKTIFRHGVATIRSGERYSLGIIFHDAL